jgi:hypothetical protein
VQPPRRRLLAPTLAGALALAILAGCGGSSSPPPPGAASGASGRQHEGGGAEAGGEKSIEEFGHEASGSEREALLASFRGYLGAVAGRDYAAACTHLTKSVHASLEQLAATRLKAKGCPAILPKLLAPTAPAIAGEQQRGRIDKVRVNGARAFVVFHAPGAKLFQMTMLREGGGWKATTVAASVLAPRL